MVPETRIRALDPGDASAAAALRREALESTPLAFGSSLADDRGRSIEGMRAVLEESAGSVVLGAFLGDDLVGMAGIVRPGKVKARHRAMIWGMFVTPGARGMGLGAALLESTVQRARGWPGVRQVHLSVTEAAPAARRLYLKAGFREWGLEPRSLCWEGQYVAERHLVLELD